MKKIITGLAVIGFLGSLLGTPVIAFGQQRGYSEQQLRYRAMDEEARANALLRSLLDTYRQILDREASLSPEQQRQIANSIDEGRLVIPELAKAVAEVYSRFRGDRVLLGASFGIGGELTFFRNTSVPLLNRVPFLKQLTTNGDASIGVAGILVRNEIDNTFFPQFAGYYSLGFNEGSGVTPAPRTAARKTAAAMVKGKTQGFTQWRVYIVPRNTLGKIGAFDKMTSDHRTIAHIGALTGTYLGGGTEMGWSAFGRRATLQTQIYGRWQLPEDPSQLISRLDPDVVMIALSPTVGFKGGSRLEAQGGLQYTGFFGIQNHQPQNPDEYRY